MAERRMFAKSIVDSDAFIDMPVTARLLYYDLGMRADDDGFVNSPKKIMRMIGASEDDMRILIARKFIIPFESGIVVIKHWRINNYLRKDRYNETNYVAEKSTLKIKENGSYEVENPSMSPTGIPSGIPTVDTGKDRLGKDRLGKDNKEYILSNKSIPYKQILDLFHKHANTLPRVRTLNEARKAKIRNLLKEYSVDDFETVFRKVGESDFLSGRSGKWTACSFDWLIKPSNFLKVIEGNYDNKESRQVDALVAWATGDGYGQDTDSEAIDVDSSILPETG